MTTRVSRHGNLTLKDYELLNFNDEPVAGKDLWTNGFERHGITHSSASAINTWVEAPCFWISNYLYGNKGKFGAAAKAGVLVEEALVNILARGWTEANAIAYASEAYGRFIALGASDADYKRAEAIPDMISMALSELRPFGEPEFDIDPFKGPVQKKVELMCKGDGWTIPIIGFTDFHFPKRKTVIDLKTTGRMPSEMSASHLRQRAIYKKAFNDHEVSFLYVTGKKSQMFTPDGMNDTLSEIKSILTRQERFLKLGDRELLRSIVPVSMDTFYWNDNVETRKSMYGI